MLQIHKLLIVLSVSGALADCPGKASFFISAPKSITALAGSCLQIPCKFEELQVNSTGNAYGLWIKNDSRFGIEGKKNVVFNSSRAVNTYPLKITGDLSKKNCTTLFSNLTRTHTDSYFFRLEWLPFAATASCDALQITVKASPSKPLLSVSGELKEKESVTITCSAPTPCPHLPPRLTWSLQQDAHSQTEENTDGTLTTKIQQTITLSDQHDGFKLSCSAVYPVDGGQHVKTAVAEFTLRVSYAPKDMSASISPSGLVSAGSWVNLSCSSRARPAVSYTWFKISDDGAVRVSEGDFHSFNVTEGGAYYCVAANDLGNQTSEQILLNVAGMEQSWLWRSVVGGILGIIIFICVIVFLWRLKSSRSTSHQMQVSQSLVLPESTRTADDEEIHYGEMDFSRMRPESFSSPQQPDVVYSQIQMSRTGNRSEHAADGPYSLYAQVMKKKY
ncbi:sialic acid-binding Ig-like lectin 6 [Salarias fasciatus]|uniref:sialic acid-binding Ig-like lectin 6 n=1 Tax=Salarias fasciatus TaxID=181472 RepID=UPI001176AD60|nr:sialic acid-binding Ig-like lectin 6 [Salarias fasciatus]